MRSLDTICYSRLGDAGKLWKKILYRYTISCQMHWTSRKKLDAKNWRGNKCCRWRQKTNKQKIKTSKTTTTKQKQTKTKQIKNKLTKTKTNQRKNKKHNKKKQKQTNKQTKTKKRNQPNTKQIFSPSEILCYITVSTVEILFRLKRLYTNRYENRAISVLSRFSSLY